MIRPPKLNRGDKVAAVTLSWGGPGLYPYRYQVGKKQIKESFDIDLVEMPNTLKPPDWIYKNPQARADDLMKAFLDPEIKAIFSTIGGDESIRILPFIDPSVLRNNPKIFMGYSDTTACHFSFYQAGLMSFYGPSIMSGFAENGGLFNYMHNAVDRFLFRDDFSGALLPNDKGWTSEILEWSHPENQLIKRKLFPASLPNFIQGHGKASGKLFGGCMETIETLKATEWWPANVFWEDKILFLEISSAPSIDIFRAWIRNYAAQGIFNKVKGILFGRPGGIIPKDQINIYDNEFSRILKEELSQNKLPFVTQLDFGHTDPMTILPYGSQVTINCAEKKIFID